MFRKALLIVGAGALYLGARAAKQKRTGPPEPITAVEEPSVTDWTELTVYWMGEAISYRHQFDELTHLADEAFAELTLRQMFEEEAATLPTKADFGPADLQAAIRRLGRLAYAPAISTTHEQESNQNGTN